MQVIKVNILFIYLRMLEYKAVFFSKMEKLISEKKHAKSSLNTFRSPNRDCSNGIELRDLVFQHPFSCLIVEMVYRRACTVEQY